MALSNLSVKLPAQYEYLLPRPFTNNFTHPFVDTIFPQNSTEDNIFQAARNASFIILDDEFVSIIGDSPSVRVIASSNAPFAFEAGVWVPPPFNQVWFTSYLSTTPGYLSILDLETSRVFQPPLTGSPLPNPNGGYYHNGTIYITFFGNETYSPGIVSIDPYTYHATEVVNSYLGLPLNGPDDVTVATSKTTNESCLFFSDFFFASEGIPGTWPGPQQLPYGVWLFRPRSQVLEAVISPQDIMEPNGVAIDPTHSILYVTDGPDAFVFGMPLNQTSGSPGIYAFDLGGEDGCTPLNKRLLGFARAGFANGIKVDDRGRVWTAEHEGGIVVRSPSGKILGLFNVGGEKGALANFALAGDELIVLDLDQILGIKLTRPVVGSNGFQTRSINSEDGL